MKIPGRADPAEMLRRLNWPPASVGGRFIAGEAAWRARLAARTGPRDRLDVFRAVDRRLLVATDVGRARLRAWLTARHAQPVTPEPLTARRARVMRELKHYGDVELLPVILDTIVVLPAPVIDMVLRECATIAVGRSTAGWISGPLPNRRPIGLSGALKNQDVADTLRHEIGHAWTIRHTSEAPTALQHAVNLQGLVRDVPRDQLRQMDGDIEALAWWLAWSWA